MLDITVIEFLRCLIILTLIVICLGVFITILLCMLIGIDCLLQILSDGFIANKKRSIEKKKKQTLNE